MDDLCFFYNKADETLVKASCELLVDHVVRE